jgi:hypothetical protein
MATEEHCYEPWTTASVRNEAALLLAGSLNSLSKMHDHAAAQCVILPSTVPICDIVVKGVQVLRNTLDPVAQALKVLQKIHRILELRRREAQHT